MPPTAPPPRQSALQRKRRSPRCPKRPLRLPLQPYGRQQESASAAQTPSRHRTLRKPGRQRRGTATWQLVGSRTARPRTGGPSGRCRGRRPPLLHHRCRRPQTRKVAGSPRRRHPQRECQSPMPEPTPVCNQDSGRRIRIRIRIPIRVQGAEIRAHNQHSGRPSGCRAPEPQSVKRFHSSCMARLAVYELVTQKYTGQYIGQYTQAIHKAHLLGVTYLAGRCSGSETPKWAAAPLLLHLWLLPKARSET